MPDDLAGRLLGALPDAVVAVDAAGIITGWHGAAERLFGWRASEALGQPFSLLFGDPVEVNPDELVTAGGAGSIDFVASCRRRRGSPFPAAVSVRSKTEPPGLPAGSMAVIRPASDRFEGSREGRRVTPQWDRTLGLLMTGLSQVAGIDLTAIERTDTLARVLCEEARRMIPETEVLFSLVPHDRQEAFRIVAGAGPWAETLVGREWARAGTVAGRSMQLRRPLETARVDDLSVLRPTLETGGIRSCRVVPLWTREPLPDGRDALGVLGWYRTERSYFTPYHRRLMREFCRLASLMLQRTELSSAATRSVGRLQGVVGAAHDLTRSLRPDEILAALVECGLDLTTSDRAAILRVEGGRMTIVAGRDRDTDGPPVGAVLPVDAARTDDGKPLVQVVMEAGGVAMGGGYQIAGVRTGLETNPVRHVVAVPVNVAGQPAIVLIFSRRRDEPFTADDASMLETVAGIAGLALRNAALYVEVEEADRVKTDFLNMAAHELRTPLTVIRGYLSMMSDDSFGPIPERWQEPLGLLRAKSEELGRLVEELLLAARLETDRLRVSLRPVELNQLAREAVDAARPRGRLRGATIRFEPARRPLVVAADPEHLLRLLDALLSNALAYSDGPPWIRVRVRALGQRRAEVEVEDRGRGIDAGDQDSVFGRFVRVTTDVQVAGTGLGLYIARELAERQGGRLVLDWSSPGQGSRFLLSLPELGDESGD